MEVVQALLGGRYGGEEFVILCRSVDMNRCSPTVSENESAR
jgi:hypothetical protein